MKYLFAWTEGLGRDKKSESVKNAHFKNKIERFMIFY